MVELDERSLHKNSKKQEKRQNTSVVSTDLIYPVAARIEISKSERQPERNKPEASEKGKYFLAEVNNYVSYFRTLKSHAIRERQLRRRSVTETNGGDLKKKKLYLQWFKSGVFFH